MRNFKLLLIALLYAFASHAQMAWIINQGTVTASENQPTVNNLFDNDINTIWSCTGSGTIIFSNTNNPFIYTGYFLYSSTVNSPASWKFYGSLDGVNFDVLDTQPGTALGSNSRKRFSANNSEQYLYYKIDFFDSANYTSSGSSIELSGLLFETNGKTESFENLVIATGASNNGNYTGDDNLEWNFTNSRDGQNFGAESRSLLMRGQDTANLIAIIDGGITRLSFDYTNAFNSVTNEAAYFNVYIEELETSKAEELVGTSSAVGNTNTTGIQTFILDNLDFRGQVKLRIEAAEKPVCIDNLGYLYNSLEPTAPDDNEVNNTFTINVDDVKWQISDYLVGMHSVYSNEPDAFYADGSYVEWMKNAGISTMRYPGGTVVKYWDWENPTGILNQDSWDPNWNTANNALPEDWTSLDEYIAVVKSSGITPMFGVNITSGHQYNRVQESIDRAVRMVQYVKDAGLGGAFWYLGNEGANGGATNEANLYKQHAQAMKAIDPNIKCMFNHNNLTPKYLKNYLAIAGDYIDIAETHGKWPYGGDPGLPPGTLAEWQKEFPLRDRKNHNRAWRNEVPILKQAAIEAGYPDLKFANNEYGLGKGTNVVGFDRYTKNLLVIDILQEHIIGNWYMSCFWSQILSFDESSLASSNNNYRLNAMQYGFELLGKAQGANMLEMTDVEGNISVYGFTAEKDDEYLVYLLNKSSLEQNVNLGFLSSGSITPAFFEGSSMVNTLDEFGEMISVNVTPQGNNAFKSVLPSMSYTRLTFKKQALTAEDFNTSNWNLKVYPNPTNSFITIKTSPSISIKQFAVFDMSGRKVNEGLMDASNTIDLQNINQGMYVIKLINSSKNINFIKIIKEGTKL
ncbi:T9SS type A sorting domain-containing protein [Tamlana sp. I1]|uniref:T9SS type A sorting domain-containing protein n=1 Tax=Tamlana sp. I1 TaxID=2762061 RepID=UPI00188F05CD|nr:T9SS type A sorting domain-containing protein [Tamlana sp. I1]